MKKKILYCLFSFLMISVFTGDLFAQDIIVKKNGDKIKAVIKEVSDTEIRYADFNDPNGIIFTIERALIKEVKFSYGKKLKEEGPSQDESYYIDDKRNNVKLNFSAIATGYTILTYERSIDLASSFEASIKIPGLGIQQEDEKLSGIGLNVGYKLKLGSLFKKNDEYRPKHLLHGWYFRPNIGYTYSKSENEDIFLRNNFDPFNFESSFDKAEVVRSFVNFGLDFGIQWILSNRLSIDLYTGFHYYAGGITEIKRDGLTTPVDDVSPNYSEMRGGDLFGDDNVGLSFGLRVGFLFNEKKKK